MEVEIISKECIKPSSPTPHHLRIHKLSLLDQIFPSMYIPMVLYYPIDNHNPIEKETIEERLQQLKKSLSQTLVRFYPFAGKVKDKLSIDCNDEGVYYVEARVNSNLSEFLSQPDVSLIHQFLPCDSGWTEATVGANIVMVQVSVFDCGGITVGVSFAHLVADGIAMSTFLKDWGVNARGCCDGAINPDFSTAPTLFPQIDPFPEESSLMGMINPILKSGKAVTRRFVFDASALAKLKAKSTSPWVPNPTRVEAVSALIWKCAMAAYKTKFAGIQKPSLVTHQVNLRRKEVPPLSEYVMGNLLGIAFAQCTAETGTDIELGNLVHELNKGIAKINGEFLKKLEGDQGLYNYCESHKEMGGAISSATLSNKGAECINFTSWCHFGFYEVDFGWGMPMWATVNGPREEETPAVLSFVCFMENKWGDSIKAWVCLEEQDMAILVCDKELLAFASMNPNVLQAGNLASRT